MSRGPGRPALTEYERFARSIDLGILVDDEDVHYLSEYTWFMDAYGYVVAGIAGEQGRKVALARLVVGLTHHDGRVVRYNNENALDCRRSNIRVCNRTYRRRKRHADHAHPSNSVRHSEP